MSRWPQERQGFNYKMKGALYPLDSVFWFPQAEWARGCGHRLKTRVNFIAT